MLSLSNAFDLEDLKNFQKKIINFLSLKDNLEIEYSTEPKIDGISASLTYKDGILVTGLSRGDGIEGEDITNMFKEISMVFIYNHESTIDIFPKVHNVTIEKILTVIFNTSDNPIVTTFVVNSTHFSLCHLKEVRAIRMNNCISINHQYLIILYLIFF